MGIFKMNNEMVISLETINDVKKFVTITEFFVHEYHFDIDACQGRYVVDASSIMGMLSLSLLNKIKVTLHTSDKEVIEKFNEKMEVFNGN